MAGFDYDVLIIGSGFGESVPIGDNRDRKSHIIPEFPY